jgi:4a-hydroxytetrahydrobiopterin dehydratase
MCAMDERMDRALSRPEAAAAVAELGWSLLLGSYRTAVAVDGTGRAVEAAAVARLACGGSDDHLRADLRADRALLTLAPPRRSMVTARDAELAGRVTAALAAVGLRTIPDADGPGRRSSQLLEIAIDALDIPAVRPFWRAVLGYADEAGPDGPTDAIVDPLWQGPAVWFQQMDAPRPQRNRIHLDLAVPPEEADARVAAAVAAGGRVVSADHAPAFRVLADPEGNEVCVTTWQGRD